MAFHDIDIVTWVLGEYPTEVYSAAKSNIAEISAIEDFDNVIITMKFPSGPIPWSWNQILVIEMLLEQVPCVSLTSLASRVAATTSALRFSGRRVWSARKTWNPTPLSFLMDMDPACKWFYFFDIGMLSSNYRIYIPSGFPCITRSPHATMTHIVSSSTLFWQVVLFLWHWV